MGVSYGSVKKICSAYEKVGLSGLDTHYERCGHSVRTAERQKVYDTALSFRREHETWGSNRIHIDLVDEYGSLAPSVRTLQRWYRQERYSEPKMCHNEPAIGKSRAVHNIWQVDAKERLILQDNQVACYLTFTDEHSGIWLGSVVFPYHRISQVPLSAIQSAFIHMFERWGKAGSLRVDNGEPLGNPKMNASPPLALWLIAMDVDMIWNKPHTPTENAKVERLQGTSARWVEIHKCHDITDLQERLNEQAVVQRSKLVIRRLRDQTRLQAFPEIETSRRTFDQAAFDPKRVYTFLASKKYVRKASAKGVVMLYGQKFNVGAKNKNITVEIKLNADTLAWEFYDNKTLLATKPALHLSEENIRNMTVFNPVSTTISNND